MQKKCTRLLIVFLLLSIHQRAFTQFKTVDVSVGTRLFPAANNFDYFRFALPTLFFGQGSSTRLPTLTSRIPMIVKVQTEFSPSITFGLMVSYNNVKGTLSTTVQQGVLSDFTFDGHLVGMMLRSTVKLVKRKRFETGVGLGIGSFAGETNAVSFQNPSSSFSFSSTPNATNTEFFFYSKYLFYEKIGLYVEAGLSNLRYREVDLFSSSFSNNRVNTMKPMFELGAFYRFATKPD
jgi:hypothetical protein